MKAYVFPGQASQFVGMGKDMYESNNHAKDWFEKANEILGFRISDIMFTGTEEQLKETHITQPSVFLHSVIKAKIADAFVPDGVAGHSLGEFSSLVINQCLSFEDGLKLVRERAEAMQDACERGIGTMAAILGLEDKKVEDICAGIDDVIPANYNSPGQLVISGTHRAVELAMEKCLEAGAKRAIRLQVGGAFHSKLMQPAQERLQAAIEKTHFNHPICPVYQNVNAMPSTDPEVIKVNLVNQLTSPVRWSQSIIHMIADGFDHFVEVGGTGSVLRGMIRQIDRNVMSESL